MLCTDLTTTSIKVSRFLSSCERHLEIDEDHLAHSFPCSRWLPADVPASREYSLFAAWIWQPGGQSRLHHCSSGGDSWTHGHWGQQSQTATPEVLFFTIFFPSKNKNLVSFNTFWLQEIRRRHRYLAHLPLTCEFSICELVLQPPVVSKETLETFAGWGNGLFYTVDL